MILGQTEIGIGTGNGVNPRIGTRVRTGITTGLE